MATNPVNEQVGRIGKKAFMGEGAEVEAKRANKLRKLSNAP